MRNVASLAMLALAVSACASASTVPSAAGPHPPTAIAAGSGYTPHRVFDTAAGEYIDFETLAARAAAADVVFFGERHGHAPGHRLQHALLEGLLRRGGATLSLEMFERDVAPIVDAYVAGSIDRARLLAQARPWPRYTTDYAPLVDFARRAGWRTVAANVPRTLAGHVAQEGLGALDRLDPAVRRHAAADLYCPDDAYRDRFVEEMRRHPMGGPDTAEAERAREQRYYESQCVKDETMAESIARVLAEGSTRPVVHVTGAFHSDHGDGIPVRVLRRAPDARVITLTLVPVADLDAVDVAPHAARADYLLLTLER
jgi:uncharacterized iron-regulated protein